MLALQDCSSVKGPAAPVVQLDVPFHAPRAAPRAALGPAKGIRGGIAGAKSDEICRHRRDRRGIALCIRDGLDDHILNPPFAQEGV